MSGCTGYNSDSIFQRFKVVEFPISFVGLFTKQRLDVGKGLGLSTYLKTLCEGRLLNFDEARQISESHRAFDIEQIDDQTIEIKYQPLNECICRAKRKKLIDNRFVCDLRLIQVDETRCCSNELHAEIGRFYLSGTYEYCNITHTPTKVDFGAVTINEKVTKFVYIRNLSSAIGAKFSYERLNSFDVVPNKFYLNPNSTKRLAISIKPTSLKVGTTLKFRIRNPNDKIGDQLKTCKEDGNYVTHIIHCKINITYGRIPKEIVVESMHKLYEPLSKYTYLNKELEIHNERKAIALNHLEVCTKTTRLKETVKEKRTTGKDVCYSEILKTKPRDGKDFCKVVEQKLTVSDVFSVLMLPYVINFGKVGLNTFGKEKLTVINKSNFKITVQIFSDDHLLFDDDKLHSIRLKLKPLEKYKLAIYCLGYVQGYYEGTFESCLDNKYKLKHRYKLEVGNPTLIVPERSLKFGMATTETFVTSVGIKIHNDFNNEVKFKWSEISSDIPFIILPISGSISGQSCKICDVKFICKNTKTKSHEVELMSDSPDANKIPIELSIVTRKLSIKFLQQIVLFKDIALNLETIEKVKLENSSRELALFYVVEPLIPGVEIKPMSGRIRPKMIMTFDIKVKIPYVLEFNFDIYLKINNKENVILPINGSVVEPKIIIQPKNIYMPRIPCYMVTYVPVTFQNLSTLKTQVEVLDTGDDNIFNVYIANGNEKLRVFEFTVEGGQTKTVFIKVCDVYRREYDMYIPFKLNGLLGPPNESSSGSTELQHYIGKYENEYENNPKIKLKSVNRDIAFCRIVGVITVPWIIFSVEKFEFNFVPHANNTIDFTMTNVSKYCLFITILTSKLAPSFSLERVNPEENDCLVNDTQIKFQLIQDQEVALSVKFHPKGHGRFVATATLFMDKYMTTPYSNLTFVGKRLTPAMIPSIYCVIFPPCHIGTTISKMITIDLEAEVNFDDFCYNSTEEKYLSVKFLDYDVKKVDDEVFTTISVELITHSDVANTGHAKLHFYNNKTESNCDVEVRFCFTSCLITLHANSFVAPIDNPYPYYPLCTQTDLYNYMEETCTFLEKWMFQQGFRRDLFPVIPDTLHAISSALTTQASAKVGKGINVSYLNFIKRIAGPLMKHVRKVVTCHGVDESFKFVKEIYDTYKSIIILLRSRGANVYVLQSKFLLSYEQFVIYADNVTPNSNYDIALTRKLLSDANLYERLNKQSWIDFILQSYKVFILDSCFFECVCVNGQPRDIVKILVDWYNEQILEQHNTLIGKRRPVTLIKNITTDLSDGVALASAILNHCPFLTNHFSYFCEVQENNKESDMITNAILIIEAINQLRLYFPLSTRDFIHPNFIHLLFLSIHLYVVLPMFKQKKTILLNPPLLRSASRHVAISPSSQEALVFTYMMLNNNRNAFAVEKVPAVDNGKKMLLSVKYTANFVDNEECLLLVHGYNKTRIFDTYIMFVLLGQISTLNPERKCRVTGPLYRPTKVDIMVASPFQTAATFKIYITNDEPSVPVVFNKAGMAQFYLRSLNLIDTEISMHGLPKESGQEVQEQKLFLQLICLSTQTGNSWIWFRSYIGEFFIKVTIQPRWDLALDTIHARVHTWPMDPCSCGESCECYRTVFIRVPCRNELMIKALRSALAENASASMMNIFDQLVETTTGKVILAMLLEEGGTDMSEILHILQSEPVYKISSRTLLPRIDRATLAQHTGESLTIPVTIPVDEKNERYTITLTSECGMDVRTYRILFVETTESLPIA